MPTDSADLKALYERAIEEIQRHLEDTRISKIAHFEMAAQYDRRNNLLKVVHGISFAIILAWLLSSQLKSTLGPGARPFVQEVLPLLLSIVVASLSALSPLLRFHERAVENRTAAQKYHSLWRHCTNWRTDFPTADMGREAVQMARKYREQLNEINRDSPQIPEWAWKRVDPIEAKGGTDYAFDEPNPA